MSDNRIIDLDFLFIPLTILAFFFGCSLLSSDNETGCDCNVNEEIVGGEG